MPVGPKGEKRPPDPYAAGIMAAKVLLREIPEEYVTTPEPTPNRAEGGKKGGKAKAEALDPEQRSEIARKASEVRWGQNGGAKAWWN